MLRPGTYILSRTFPYGGRLTALELGVVGSGFLCSSETIGGFNYGVRTRTREAIYVAVMQRLMDCGGSKLCKWWSAGFDLTKTCLKLFDHNIGYWPFQGPRH